MSPVGLRYKLCAGGNPDLQSVMDDQPTHVMKPSVSFRLNKSHWLPLYFLKASYFRLLAKYFRLRLTSCSTIGPRGEHICRTL